MELPPPVCGKLTVEVIILKKNEKKDMPFPMPNPAWPMETITPIATDPMGMYTGIPMLFEDDEPVQDADDL